MYCWLYWDQWCTYPEHNFTQITKHYIVVPNICGFSEYSLLHGTLLAPRLLMWLPDLNIIGVYPLTGTTGRSPIDWLLLHLPLTVMMPATDAWPFFLHEWCLWYALLVTTILGTFIYARGQWSGIYQQEELSHP